MRNNEGSMDLGLDGRSDQGVMVTEELNPTDSSVDAEDPLNQAFGEAIENEIEINQDPSQRIISPDFTVPITGSYLNRNRGHLLGISSKNRSVFTTFCNTIETIALTWVLFAALDNSSPNEKYFSEDWNLIFFIKGCMRILNIFDFSLMTAYGTKGLIGEVFSALIFGVIHFYFAILLNPLNDRVNLIFGSALCVLVAYMIIMVILLYVARDSSWKAHLDQLPIKTFLSSAISMGFYFFIMIKIHGRMEAWAPILIPIYITNGSLAIFMAIAGIFCLFFIDVKWIAACVFIIFAYLFTTFVISIWSYSLLPGYIEHRKNKTLFRVTFIY